MLYQMAKLVESVQKAEGGYWDDPIGGPTNFGIRQKTLTALRSKYPGLPSSVELLTKEEAAAIIETEYIVKLNIHKLPANTALVQAHMGVMSWDDGIRIMQKRFNLKVDGVIGPKTIAMCYKQDNVGELRGILSDVNSFVRSRTNGYSASYETRFANLFL